MDRHEPEVWSEIGSQAFYAGRYRLAASSYRHAYDAQLKNIEVLVNLGYSLMYLDDYAAAAAVFEEAGRLYPHNLQVMMGLGTAFRGQGKFSEALRCFHEATVLEPNSSAPYSEMADVHWQMGSPELAREAIAIARERDPTDIFIEMRLGDAAFSARDYQTAMRHYNQAVSSDASDPIAQFKLGKAWLRLQNYVAARQAFRSALVRRPEWADLFYYLGVVEESTRNRQAAILAFEQTMKLDPCHEAASRQLIRLLLRSFRPRQAWTNYKRAIRCMMTQWTRQHTQ